MFPRAPGGMGGKPRGEGEGWGVGCGWRGARGGVWRFPAGRK